jgi:hypothetical protein
LERLNRNNQFVPDYSFSSLSHNVHVNESTEMLEQDTLNNTDKEIYHQTVKDTIISTEEFRRSTMKEKQNKRKRFSFKSLFQRNKNQNEGQPRIIHINNRELNDQQKFMSNSVSTAKYNVVTFLPKFLYEEFSKAANVFFLFISGIQV